MTNEEVARKQSRVDEIERLIGNGMCLSVVSLGNYIKLRQEKQWLVAEIRSHFQNDKGVA